MIQIKRFLLLLVIAFAVPVQGMAAVSSGICMTFGHHDAPGQAADHHHGPVAGAQADDSSGGDADHQGGAHCGPCVACCGASSIASSSARVVPVLPGLAVQPPYVEGVAGILPDSLDRPPLAL